MPIIGTQANDVLFGTSGNDEIYGEEGDDVIYAGAGADYVEGWFGNDVLYGEAGNDVLYGDAGNDFLAGGRGDDDIYGGSGIDQVGISDFFELIGYDVYSDGTGIIDSADGLDYLDGVERGSFFDGTTYTDAGASIMQVSRLYEVALGRGADAYGLNQWTDLIDAGAPLSALANGFLGSPEFNARYGPLTDGQFVAQLYRNSLGREPDTAGLASWTNLLASGASRADVLTGFSESAEYVGISMATKPVIGLFNPDETAAAVGRLYRAAFDRDPDANGLLGWSIAVDDGLSLDAVADQFVASQEFALRYGVPNDGLFVDLLYLNVLDRNADLAGRNFWTDQLRSGALDRGDVLNDFAQSTEFQIATAQDYSDGVDVLLV